MVSYYGYTISPNQIETGEGFLICRNVPIARTGDQTYFGYEVGLKGMDAMKTVIVHRPAEEVFSDAAIASFEGKPVTNNHPPHLIGPDDVEMYEKGHIEVVRKGNGEWDGYLIGDIHIHSRELIEAVKNGKREISCGYACEFEKNMDGTYTQCKIRGNHIAVVERARAGKRAAILDSNIEKPAVNARKKGTMKRHVFLRLFGLASKDKTPEEIRQMAMDAAEAIEEETDTTPGGSVKEDPQVESKEETQMDESILDSLAEKVAEKLEARQQERENADADLIQEAINKLEGKPEGEKKETKVVPIEESDQSCSMDSALAMAILKTMQPAVAALEDARQRKEVADALIRCVTDGNGAGDIGKLVRASQKAAETRAQETAGMDMEAIQAAYDAMNPHKRKETK